MEQYDRLFGDKERHEDKNTDKDRDTDEDADKDADGQADEDEDKAKYEYENATDVLGWTRGHHDIFRPYWYSKNDVVSSNHPLVNITDIAGKTVLHYAAMEGNL